MLEIDGELIEAADGLLVAAAIELLVAPGVVVLPLVPPGLSLRLEVSFPCRMAVTVEVALIAAAIVLKGRGLDDRRRQDLD